MFSFSLAYRAIGPYRRLAIIVASLMIFAAFTESLGIGLILPALEMITNAKGEGVFIKILHPLLQIFPEHHAISIVLLLILALVFLKNISRFALNFYVAQLVTGLYTMWLRNILTNYMEFRLEIFMKYKHGELVNNVYNEPSKAAQAVNDILDLFSRIVLALCVFIVLLLSSWQTTLVASILLGSLLVVTHKASQKYAASVGENKLKCTQEIYATGAEILIGIRQVKILHLYNNRKNVIDHLLKKYINYVVKFELISKSPFPIIELIIVTCIVGTAIYFNSLSSGTSLNELLPVIGLFLVAARPLMNSVSTFATLRMTIANNVPSLKLVQALSESHDSLEKTMHGYSIKKLDSNIIFKNINFSHAKGKEIFNNLNLKITKNAITAIVGPSGAGKSTLLDLLLGLYKPTVGEIIVNNTPLTEVKLADWRKLIGYIGQDTFLFHVSIRENILMGNPNASEAEMIRAAKLANAHDFIMALPQKYDTIIGDRGDTLSGGQKQRISIARAVIRNADLYIFDEPTSALDSESEEEIRKTIFKLKENKTVLIISHRLSIVKDVDCLYEIKDGKILVSSYQEQYNKKTKQVAEV